MNRSPNHRNLVVIGIALSVIGCQPAIESRKTDAPKLVPEPVATPAPTKPPAPTPALLTFERPKHVRGIYLTAWSAGSVRKMDTVAAMIKRTELNAVVIDVRDDGDMYWKTGIALAKESGADRKAVPNAGKLMARLQAEGIYPIARIACFRDAFVPRKHPERAVNTSEGVLWKDRSGHTWLDPYNHKNWEYLAETVDYALDQGFPEVQLDYVRFPSEGKASIQRFPAKKYYGNGRAKPEDVIAAFAVFIGKRVRARGAVYSADLFGIISSTKSDQGIGQDLEKVAEPFDLICPMVYPSHYAKGEYGIKDPNAQPYSIVRKSLNDYRKRLPNTKIRPWLQDFFGYSAKSIQAQIKAAKELGYEEYLLWNASNKYTEAAVVDNSKLLAQKPSSATGVRKG